MEEFDCIVSTDGKEIVSLQVVDSESMKPNTWYSSKEIGLMIKCKSNKWKLGNSDKAEADLSRMNEEFNK